MAAVAEILFKDYLFEDMDLTSKPSAISISSDSHDDSSLTGTVVLCIRVLETLIDKLVATEKVLDFVSRIIHLLSIKFSVSSNACHVGIYENQKRNEQKEMHLERNKRDTKQLLVSLFISLIAFK